ncbi:hypothetical protein JCM1840_000425 [Sporobolomyces johnsonii]
MSTTTRYAHGFQPVHRNPNQLSPAAPNDPPQIPLDDLLALIPTTPLAKKAYEHVKDQLGCQIHNHSHRAFLHAAAIQKGQFPDWDWDAESLYIATLFHDLGATEANLRSTKMSFELHGAVLAREFLLSTPEGQAQTDLAVNRHTNFVDSMISANGQLIQFGTLFDNVGEHPSWIHPATVEAIAAQYPRKGWTSCFHDTMKREIELKPWSHTTIYDFTADEQGKTDWDRILGNAVAKPIEEKEAAKQ